MFEENKIINYLKNFQCCNSVTISKSSEICLPTTVPESTPRRQRNISIHLSSRSSALSNSKIFSSMKFDVSGNE
ncbi:hypothetical protein SteCoe_26650 [Stentor coeruleus]|uniref:Uncharacterized protein n=1 Tax=Stentor coeruleus TaxID=5963 RepID=A0A1R2BCE0_9CILI|nr:hypothetical protein SteCoe_26650 [Stentor coeruleus]